MTGGETDQVRISAITDEKIRQVNAVSARLERQARAREAENSGEETIIPPAPPPAPPTTAGRVPAAYRVLPATLGPAATNPAVPRWRIELHTAGASDVALGLDICGDVIIGRGTDGSEPPDLDLEPYHALGFGVSRRHALLRPTRQGLYLIDLHSTNGTRCNGMALQPGQAHPLQHEDVFSLGNMVFLLKIVNRPEATPTGKKLPFIRQNL